MRSINHFIKISVTFTLLLILFSGCNKEDMEAEKAMHVVVNGYNGSGNKLEVSIDTTTYSEAISNGKFVINPASMVSFNAVYTYRTAKERMLLIKDPANGRVLFSKPLPATGTKAAFNFIYIDGEELVAEPPVADTATNKLAFYVHYTGSNEPFDISLYWPDNNTGQEYRLYLAKNVYPGTWIYADYMPSPDFAALSNSSIRFNKAGTTDQWAFLDNEMQSTMPAFNLSLPRNGEKGMVQPYFITPGSFQLEMSRLFFYPDKF